MVAADAPDIGERGVPVVGAASTVSSGIPLCNDPPRRRTSRIACETLVAYWVGDLESAESDRVEEHVMGCASCTAASGRVAVIAEAMRAQIPPIASRQAVTKLRARGAHRREPLATRNHQ